MELCAKENVKKLHMTSQFQKCLEGEENHSFCVNESEVPGSQHTQGQLHPTFDTSLPPSKGVNKPKEINSHLQVKGLIGQRLTPMGRCTHVALQERIAHAWNMLDTKLVHLHYTTNT